MIIVTKLPIKRFYTKKRKKKNLPRFPLTDSPLGGSFLTGCGDDHDNIGDSDDDNIDDNSNDHDDDCDDDCDDDLESDGGASDH